MAIQKSEAIVLKTHHFRETSLIVHFFTRDFGKIHGLIKGIRNEPQRYGGLPLSFSRNQIIFYERPQSDLHLVTQCDAEEGYAGIRTDLQKTHYAQYFIELLDCVTENNDKNEHLFELMAKALGALAQGITPSWYIARSFEIKLLNLSGFKPRLDSCVHCQGAPLGQGRFSALLGGILCGHCASSDKSAKVVLKEAWLQLNILKMRPGKKRCNSKLPRRSAKN